MQMTREEGVRRVYDGRSHVVILGAGASIAATLRDSEATGKRLPSMEDFVAVLGLEDLVREAGLGDGERNFERIYSELYAQDPASPLLAKIESRVHQYFADMALPPTPTIYDYLVMSLRPKDLIATFNWDPFLFQAWNRNFRAADMPRIAFLHGSVSIGYSTSRQKAGPAGMFADAECREEFVPSRLLYPVAVKDYNTDDFIAREWDRLRKALATASRMTIFGYGVPATDVEAVSLMSEAWGVPDERNLEQIEIIDVQPEAVLTRRWEAFIHTHHYDALQEYWESSLAAYPRRTHERFMHQFLPSTVEEAFQEPNPVPRDLSSLQQLWDWHRPLVEAEEAHEEARD